MVDSLHCTNCGAPLRVSANQTVAACLYCNSTLRVVPGAAYQPAVTRMEAVPPEVVDEVKRLLVLGNQPKAVAYYARETGMTEAEATAAVSALARTVGYAPPLNWLGLAMLLGYTALGVAAITWGASQIGAGRGALALVVLVAGALWVLINWLALGRGLRGFWLAQRGVPAEAVIRKRLTIRTTKAAGEPQPVELVRFLLEVQPRDRAAYETEANGMVRYRSYARTQPGCRMRLKYDPHDPMKVVLLGPVELA
jgi:hypothetical protein